MRYGDQHAIRSPPLGLGLNCGYKLTICWVKGLYRAKGQALSAALGDGIAGVEVRGLQLANHEKLKADGAAADYENGFTWRETRLLTGFDDGGAADAAGGDFDQDFVVVDFGDGNFFDAHNSLFAVDAGAHGLGNGAKCLERFDDSAGPAHRAATSANPSPSGDHPCVKNDSFLI